MKRYLQIVLGLLVTLAVLLVVPALNDNRVRKLEVYRAFIASYGEGNPINLADVTHRFDAPSGDVLVCAPSALVTTAISRHFRTLSFTQNDFPDPSVRIVDPDIQRVLVHVHDPSGDLSSDDDIDEAVRAAFDAGLLQVSDIGFDVTGQRALLTFSFSCGMLCGHRGTAMLEHRGGQWVRSQQNCGPESIS